MKLGIKNKMLHSYLGKPAESPPSSDASLRLFLFSQTRGPENTQPIVGTLNSDPSPQAWGFLFNCHSVTDSDSIPIG